MIPETNNISEEVNKIRIEYQELLSEIEVLYQTPEKKIRSRIIGVFTGSGALTEKLLLSIIKKEGKESQLSTLNGKPGIFEYKKTVEDVIPKQQNIHIGTIIQWRNLVSHANDIDKVDRNELRAVSSALQSLLEWFFKDYLKQGSPNEDVRAEKANTSTGEPEGNSIDDHFNKPDFSILKQSKKVRRENKMPLLILGLIVLVLSGGIFYFFKSTAKSAVGAGVNTKNVKMGQDEVFEFLVGYFNSFNDRNHDPYIFFAKKIDQFYGYSNLNPTEVQIHRQTSDYIDNKHLIDKESLFKSSESNEIRYWRFWNDFSCYRPSLKKYQTCKVLMEFGINSDNKITSIKEIKILSLKFHRKKPKA